MSLLIGNFEDSSKRTAERKSLEETVKEIQEIVEKNPFDAQDKNISVCLRDGKLTLAYLAFEIQPNEVQPEFLCTLLWAMGYDLSNERTVSLKNLNEKDTEDISIVETWKKVEKCCSNEEGFGSLRAQVIQKCIHITMKAPGFDCLDSQNSSVLWLIELDGDKRAIHLDLYSITVLSPLLIVGWLRYCGVDLLTERCFLRVNYNRQEPEMVYFGPTGGYHVRNSDGNQLQNEIIVSRGIGYLGSAYNGWIQRFVKQLDMEESNREVKREPIFEKATAERNDLNDLFVNLKKYYGFRVATQTTNFFMTYMGSEWNKYGRRGILFFGPPGTGKSSLCKIIKKKLSNRVEVLIHVAAADLNSRYVGESEKKIRDIVYPASLNRGRLFLVILEEIDTLAADPDKKQNGGQDYKRDVLTVLLDAISENENIIFISTTNFKDKLDERIIRSKRLGEHILVSSPPFKTRLKLFKKYLFFENDEERSNLVKALGEKKADEKITIRKSFFQNVEWCATISRSFSFSQIEHMSASMVAYHGSMNLKDGHVAYPVPGLISPEDKYVLNEFETMLHAALSACATSSSTRTISQYFLSPLIEHVKSLNSPLKGKEGKKVWFATNINTEGKPLLDQLQNASGCFVWMNPSGKISFDYYKNCGQLNSANIILPLNNDFAITMMIEAMMHFYDVDFLGWIAAESRQAHPGPQFDHYVNDLLEEARCAEGTGMIVVEVDSVAGLTPLSNSHTWSVNASSNESKAEANSESTTFSKTRSWGDTSSRSTGTSTTESTGVSFGKSEGTTLQSTTGVSFGMSTATSEGGSDTHTAGVTIGASLLGPSASASYQYSNTRCWNITKSTNVGRNEAKTHGNSKQINTATNSGATKGTNDTQVMGSNKGGAEQEGGAKGKTLTTTSGNSTGTGNSITLVQQVQYPKELSTVLQLAGNINRFVRASDPIVIMLYRNIEPIELDMKLVETTREEK